MGVWHSIGVAFSVPFGTFADRNTTVFNRFDKCAAVTRPEPDPAAALNVGYPQVTSAGVC